MHVTSDVCAARPSDDLADEADCGPVSGAQGTTCYLASLAEYVVEKEHVEM